MSQVRSGGTHMYLTRKTNFCWVLILTDCAHMHEGLLCEVRSTCGQEKHLNHAFVFTQLPVCPVEGTEPRQQGSCSMREDRCLQGDSCAHHALDGWHVCCSDEAPPSCDVSQVLAGHHSKLSGAVQLAGFCFISSFLCAVSGHECGLC